MCTLNLKILSDIQCDVYVDGVNIGSIDKNVIRFVPLMRGEYWLQFVSTLNPSYRLEQIVFLEYDKVVKLDFADFINSNKELALDDELIFDKQHKSYLNVLSGKQITASIYDDGRQFEKGVASVIKDGLWGRIDKQGNEVVPCEYLDENCSFKLITPFEFSTFFNQKETNNEYIPQFINDGIKVKKNELWGIIDKNGNELLSCWYEKINDFNEGFALVKRDGKYGYVDINWNEAIPCVYKYAQEFREGLAAVCNDEGWGFIDYLGNEVIRCQYESAHSFNEGVAITSYTYYDSSGGHSPTNSYIIDKSGRNLYFGMEDISNDLHEGLIAQNTGYEAGYINKVGEKVIPFIYQYTSNFINGMGYVTTHDNLRGIIDTLGNQIVPPIYDYISPFDGNFAKVSQNKKYGIIDITGKVIVPCKYDNIYDFNEGLAWVRDEKGKFGCINKNGEEIIKCQYEFKFYPLGFSEGISPIFLNNKYGYIDRYGNQIIPCKYDHAWSFTHGLAVVGYGGDWFGKGRKCGVIDKFGNELIACKYENLIIDASTGLIVATLDNKVGLIDKMERILLPFVFENIYDFKQQFAWVKKDGNYGIIKKIE